MRIHALLIDASYFPNANALQRHCRAELAERCSRHKEILLDNAERGPESDGASQAKVLCEQLPSVDQLTCSWTHGTACAVESLQIQICFYCTVTLLSVFDLQLGYGAVGPPYSLLDAGSRR